MIYAVRTLVPVSIGETRPVYELSFDAPSSTWMLSADLGRGETVEIVGRGILGTGPGESGTAQRWATNEIVEAFGDQTVSWEPSPAAETPWRYVGRRVDVG
jgi:hypothetical protein